MAHRIEQVNRLIQKNLGSIIQREVELPRDAMVSITKVTTGPDLKTARVAVSVLPESSSPDVLTLLERSRPLLGRSLAATLTMKFSPRIEFVADTAPSRASRIEGLLDSLRHEHS